MKLPITHDSVTHEWVLPPKKPASVFFHFSHDAPIPMRIRDVVLVQNDTYITVKWVGIGEKGIMGVQCRAEDVGEYMFDHKIQRFQSVAVDLWNESTTPQPFLIGLRLEHVP